MNPIYSIRLSDLCSDPVVRDAFLRAERDQGGPLSIEIEPEPILVDGEAVEMEEAA